MGNWEELLEEIKGSGSTFDIIRRKYLKKLYELTGRNVIAYYSGWLQKQMHPLVASINDNDKNGFMSTLKGMDKSKGLDLILHTPGGETAATESLVDYLRSLFGTNIRAIVPQLAMSAGTMIACACKEILMGKHSSLGPIDPQFNGIPAQGVIEEFEKAYNEIKANPAKIPVWQPIIAKYPPAFIGECQKAINWSEYLVKKWLGTGMLADLSEPLRSDTANRIVEVIGSHDVTLSHSRHLPPERCIEVGLRISMLEQDNELQDAVLTVHHTFIHTLSATQAGKIIENHLGSSFIQI
ncbi:MAG: ATP-dependent Clp protease proteolytic subunit [bacterium]|nr:ATP-dependent Clp protease proteolytic subunit [bacterium]